jgi:hypothetical protein
MVILGLVIWAMSQGRAAADLTLTSGPSGSGNSAFDVKISGVPDLASYGMNVLLQLPGVSFDGNSVMGNPGGTSYTVATTTGAVLTITLNTGGPNYIFTDNSNFFGNLNTVPGQPDELEIYLSDFGTVNSTGSGSIANINVNTSTLTGSLAASIESDSLTLQLLDSTGNPVSQYGTIQQQVAAAAPVDVILSPSAVVPEPSTLGFALLGFVAILYGVRRGWLG